MLLVTLLRYRFVINLGRRGAAVLIALTGAAAFAGGVGVAALTTPTRSTAPAAIVIDPPLTPATTTAAPSRTPTLTPSPTPRATPRLSATPKPRPSATRSPVPSRPGAPAASGVQAQVVALTNQARATAGCAPLEIDARLTRAAQAHSEDMARRGYFEHDSLDGRDFADRIRAAGYPSPAAENIARGQRTAAAVVQAWLDSPGHRRNILDCSFVAIGVGYAANGSYWTQDFGR